jgi:hypothetical protein
MSDSDSDFDFEFISKAAVKAQSKALLNIYITLFPLSI